MYKYSIMNVLKLFKAASLVKNTHPELSKEIKKLAIDIQNVDSGASPTDTSFSGVDTGNQNAGESQYFNNTPKDKKTVHSFEISVEVPPETSENVVGTLVQNALESKKNEGWRIVGFQFKLK